MITDIYTIVRKELIEILQTSNSRGRGKFGLLILFGVLGIFLPLQLGEELVTSGIGLILWGWVPMILISAVVGDSFAGERERKTLESLLATRLSDSAILFGKILAGVFYGYILTWGLLITALVTINISNTSPGIIIFSPIQFVTIGLIALLTCFLVTSVGVLVSLRAESVRQAQQTLSMMVFLLFIPLFVINFLPENIKFRVYEILLNTDIQTVALIGIGLLLILDVILIAASMSRFKRTRLILE